MRKNMLFAGLITIVASLASCQKLNDNPTVAGIAGIPVTLNVIDVEWTPDSDSRTAYTPGTGIRMTGTEEIKLFYKSDKLYNNEIKASPTGTPDEYSFTMPTEAEECSAWYGVMPYSKSLAALTSNGNMATVRLGPVQFPGANSFDPMSDWMVLKPFAVEGSEGAKSGTIDGFKRLFAPLCLSVSGLPAGSRIFTATLSLDQEPTNTEALSGLFYINLGDTFDGTSISSAEKTSRGNAISAEYGSGLAAVDDVWPIWLMTGPITMNAGANLTLSVSTENRTFTRTVVLPSSQTLSTATLNRIKFNMTGSGYTSRESVTQDFANQTLGGTKVLTASDGSSISWVTTTTREFRASDDGGSCIKGALNLQGTTNNTFTFPTIAGKNITAARIFTHPASRSSSSANVKLTVDGADEYIFNLSQSTLSNSMAYKGGAIDISLPAGRTSLSGLTVATTNQMHLISAITLFTEDKAIDPNDYYEQFLAGNDITINGEVFNKATYGTPRLIKAYEMANAIDLVADVATGGILFLDWDPADGEEDVYAPLNNLKPANVVIIGRYRNHQPHIDLSVNGNFSWGPTAGKVVFKNVELTTNNYMFLTGNATEPVSFSIEDCTLNCNSFYIFCESKAGGFLKDVTINNSVINFTRGLWGNTSALTSGTELTDFTKFHVTNSVLYSKTSVSYPLFPFRPSSTAYYATPNLDINLDHCTLYNSQSNNLGVLALYNASKVNFNYCVCEAPLAGNQTSTIVMVPAVLEPKVTDSTISNNYGNNSSANELKWAYGYSAATNSGITVSGNKFVIGATPFSSADTATGYFPVNTSVVTNGAGASYSTKLWKTWE